MFTNFTDERIDVGDATLRVRRHGEGPPLLLLHGYPETHAMWHAVAPELADRFSVVCPDLRGYGDSRGPDDPVTEDYSNRSMAGDMTALMAELGHDTFRLVGHDRGARVGYRLTLDAPERVERFVALDIIPTLETFEAMDYEYAESMYHWLFLAQAYPLPETLIGADPTFYLEHMMERWSASMDGFTDEALAEYRRCFEQPSVVRASCADYRAGFHVDTAHDRESRATGDKIECPMLALWGAGSGTVSFDPLDVWERWASDVRGRGLDCGHFLPEEAPEETLAALETFL
ncbi:alpha/beta fold hydrolase [Natronomonas salsuginis]|uniref:Alpha/beta hydrolase n=1 Tax=Natronomonas salsuginis TaxID=2217661 RepID=A0A4U5JBG2_9EURY|nr:alpha/beta hydrolase [Natronomonas salsuginis]TKR24877.1 alpha/beta hydrolase [Natronomonas salsuginis]